MDNKNKRLNTSDGLIAAWREATGGKDTAKDSHTEFLKSLEAANLGSKTDPALAKWRQAASLFNPAPAPMEGINTESSPYEPERNLFDDGEQR